MHEIVAHEESAQVKTGETDEDHEQIYCIRVLRPGGKLQMH